MEIILIAGAATKSLVNLLNNKSDIFINKSFNLIEKHIENNDKNKEVLIIDYGFGINQNLIKEELSIFKKLLNNSNMVIKLLTRNKKFSERLMDYIADKRLEIYLSSEMRVDIQTIKQIILSQNTNEDVKKIENSKKNLFSKVLGNISKNKIHENPMNTFLELKSKKVFLITGHRNSGVTGTAVNTSICASANNLECLLIDFDIEYKGTNIYFQRFGEEVELNPELGKSLIKNLCKADNICKNSCRINENLKLVALAYSEDLKNISTSIIDEKKIINLINYAKQDNDLVIIDMPIEILAKYQGILSFVDGVGICLQNNLHSVIKTAKMLENFSKDTLMLLKLKAGLILTNYNEANQFDGDEFSYEIISKLIVKINSLLELKEMQYGIIQHSNEYDLMLESGKKLYYQDDTYELEFNNILKQLYIG